MNKKQRSRLETIKDKLDELAAEVREIGEEEQEKYNNAPENLQNSEKYQAIEGSASTLSDAADEIEQASSSIDDTLSQ